MNIFILLKLNNFSKNEYYLKDSHKNVFFSNESLGIPFVITNYFCGYKSIFAALNSHQRTLSTISVVCLAKTLAARCANHKKQQQKSTRPTKSCAFYVLQLFRTTKMSALPKKTDFISRFEFSFLCFLAFSVPFSNHTV